MAKHGWWYQVFNDAYPETQTSYGQDMQALKGETPTGKALGVLLPDQRVPSGRIYDPTKLAKGKKRRPFRHISFHKQAKSSSSFTEGRYKAQRVSFPARRSTKTENNLKTEIVCLNCGNKRIVTLDFVKKFIPQLKSLSDKGMALYIRRVKARLKCSKCGQKSIEIRSR